MIDCCQPGRDAVKPHLDYQFLCLRPIPVAEVGRNYRKCFDFA